VCEWGEVVLVYTMGYVTNPNQSLFAISDDHSICSATLKQTCNFLSRHRMTKTVNMFVFIYQKTKGCINVAEDDLQLVICGSSCTSTY